MGATRKITIEVSEEAASALEADPERARLLVEMAARAGRARGTSRLRAILTDPSRPRMSEEEVAAELAAWNAEGRS